MRKQFDAELKELEMLLIKMFNCAEGSVVKLVAVLSATENSEELTNAAMHEKDVHNEATALSSALETLCLKLLIHQQPVAKDLREIKSAMKAVYDLVRITEMCFHTAEIVCGGEYQSTVSSRESAGARARIENMRRASEVMVRQVADAYLKRDKLLAQTVIDADDGIDADFLLMRKELVKILKTREGRDDWVLDCLLISKYMERIADHAVKIAREALFLCA